MDLDAIYRLFPDEGSCIAFMEESRWGEGRPTCPHCGARKASAMPAEHRHHCNGCGISFSVTTRTFMHRTRADLRQWLVAVLAATERRRGRMGSRELAGRAGVHPNTASGMLKSIRVAQVEEPEFFGAILQGLLTKVQDGRT